LVDSKSQVVGFPGIGRIGCLSWLEGRRVEFVYC
jgi:hypothetical protein